MATRQSISSPSTNRGPSASWYKKAYAKKVKVKRQKSALAFLKSTAKQEAEKKAEILKKTRSISRQTDGGGRITVTRAGKVTESDSSGNIVRQFETTKESAEKFILGQTAEIKRQAYVREKQKKLFEQTSKLLQGRTARTVNVAPNVSTSGVSRMTVTKGGKVTERDSSGRVIRTYYTDPLSAAKFIAQPETFTPSKIIKKSVDPDFLKERDFSVQVKQEGLIGPTLSAAQKLQEKIKYEQARIQKPLTFSKIGGLSKETVSEFIHSNKKTGTALKKYIKENKITGKQLQKLELLRIAQTAMAVPTTVLQVVNLFNLPKTAKDIKGITSQVKEFGLTPTLTKAGTALGNQFLINPSAVIVEFIVYSQALGVVGKGVKSLGIGTKVAKAMYLNRIPKAFKAAYSKILNSAKARRLLKASKVPAKINLIKIASTASKAERSIINGVLKKFGGVVFKSSKVGALNNAAIIKLRQFSTRFLKAVPKSMRGNYVIKNGIVFNKVAKKFVFNSQTVSVLSKTRSLSKFISESLNKVLFKATGKIVKIKLKPGLKAGLVRIGTSKPIRIINLGSKKLSRATIRSLSSLRDGAQNLGINFTYVQLDATKVIKTLSAPVLRKINKIMSNAAAFPSKSKSLLIETVLKINRAIKKFNIKIKNLIIKGTKKVLNKVTPLRNKLIKSIDLKLAKIDLKFQIKKLKFDSKFMGAITEVRNTKLLKDIERLSRLIKKSKNKFTIGVKKAVGRINKPLKKFYNIKLVTLREGVIKKYQIGRVILNNKQYALARKINIIVDSTTKSIQARVGILSDKLLDIRVRYTVSFELNKRFALQSLDFLTQKTQQRILRQLTKLRRLLVKSKGVINKEISKVIQGVNKNLKRVIPGKIVKKAITGVKKFAKGIKKDIITTARGNIVAAKKILNSVKPYYDALGFYYDLGKISIKIKLLRGFSKLKRLSPALISKEIKRQLFPYIKSIRKLKKLSSNSLRRFTNKLNKSIKKKLPFEIEITTPVKLARKRTIQLSKARLKKIIGLTNAEKQKIGKLFDPTLDLTAKRLEKVTFGNLRAAVKKDLLARAKELSKIRGISIAKAKRLELERLVRAAKKVARAPKEKALAIRQTQKALKRAAIARKETLKQVRISAANRKLLQVRQGKILNKIARGEPIKAVRSDYVTANGKKVWQLLDARGNVKRFTSRKKWLSEIKIMSKVEDKIKVFVGKSKPTNELLRAFKDKRKIDKNILDIDKITIIKKKGSTTIISKQTGEEIFKVSKKVKGSARRVSGAEAIKEGIKKVRAEELRRVALLKKTKLKAILDGDVLVDPKGRGVIILKNRKPIALIEKLPTKQSTRVIKEIKKGKFKIVQSGNTVKLISSKTGKSLISVERLPVKRIPRTVEALWDVQVKDQMRRWKNFLEGVKKLRAEELKLKFKKVSSGKGIEVITRNGQAIVKKNGKIVLSIRTTKRVREINKAIKDKIKQTARETVKPKTGYKEVKVGRTMQLVKVKKKTKQIVKEVQQISETVQKTKNKSRQILIQVKKIKQIKNLTPKKIRWVQNTLTLAAKLLIVGNKQKAKLKVLSRNAQLLLPSLKQVQKPKTAQISATKQLMKLKELTDVISKTITVTLEDLVSISRTATKTIQKYKLTSVSLGRQKQKMQEVIPPPKLLLDLERRLNNQISRRTSKRKFIYIPDLYSTVLKIKASAKEKKAYLKKGAIFTGAEIRKLIV